MMLNDALKYCPELERRFREWGKMSGVDDVAVGEDEVNWKPIKLPPLREGLGVVALIGFLTIIATVAVFTMSCVSIVHSISWFPPQLIWLCAPLILMIAFLIHLFNKIDRRNARIIDIQSKNEVRLYEKTRRVMIQAYIQWGLAEVRFGRRGRIDKKQRRDDWTKVTQFIASVYPEKLGSER